MDFERMCRNDVDRRMTMFGHQLGFAALGAFDKFTENSRKRFGLRFNLIAALYNADLALKS
jgi:hypothetical protein